MSINARSDGVLKALQTLVHAPLALQQVIPAHEPIAMSKKRVNPATTSNESKRAKANVAVQQDTENFAANTVVKKEQEQGTIDISSGDKELKPEGVDNFDTKEVRHPVDMPIHLHIRTESGHDIIKGVDELPVLVSIELKGRFRVMWSFNKMRTHRYATLTFHPAKYMVKSRCIRNLVIRGGPDEEDRYSQGGEYRESADNRCLKARQPCAYFAEHDGQHVILLVPLPKALRQGKDWTELGYWVL